MSPDQHPHAAANNLQTRRHGTSSSVWQTGARIALFGLAINIVLASVKILAGFFGHAYVLIADGIESALDVGGSIVIWGGLTIAARPPDRTHPYGHGKAEPIAAVAVAAGVLVAALGLAIQSVREISLPHHGPAPYTLVVLIVAVIVKETLYRYVIRFGRDLESTAVQTDAWHHRTDAITSIAAFIGISVALSAVKRGKAQTTGPRSLPVRSLAQAVFVFCVQLCTRSWIPRRAGRLSGPFAGPPDRSPASSRLRSAAPAKWVWIFMSIFMLESMAAFPWRRDTRLRIR